MFAVLHSDINSLKSGLLHLTGQPYCKKSRSAKAKDGIINLILRNYLVDRYTLALFFSPSHQWLTTSGCDQDYGPICRIHPGTNVIKLFGHALD
jgi:hypothetical protein